MPTMPTPESLRHAPRPAWLWDGERRRLAWANRAALALFGEDSLLELIDRPFAPRDPMVEKLAEAADDVRDGDPPRVTLAFNGDDVELDVFAHALPDGRPGLLVVGRRESAVGRPDLFRETLEVMPLAVLMVDAEGTLLHANAAAREMIEAAALADPARLFGDKAGWRAFLDEAARRGLAAKTRRAPTRHGRRMLRITARPLRDAGGDGDLFALLLEDVSDRRRLEEALRRQGGWPAPAGGAPGAAPEEAGRADLLSRIRSLKQSVEDAAREIAEARKTPPPPAATEERPADADEAGDEAGVVFLKRKDSADVAAQSDGKEETRPTDPPPPRPEVPALVRDVLDHRPDPIVLHRAGQFLYANTAARHTFGHGEADDAWGDLANQLMAAADGDVIRLATADGARRRFVLKRDVFPWREGAVVQSTLLAADDGGPETEDEATEDGGSRSTPGAPDAAAERATAQVVRLAGRRGGEETSKSRLRRMVEETGARPTLQETPLDDELRAILDTATDGIITLNRGGEILSFSAGAESLFGLAAADAVGRPFVELFEAEQRRAVEEYLAALASDSSLPRIYNEGREVTARVKNGGEIALFLTIGRMGRADTPPRAGRAAWCAVVRDITQWKKTESELRRAKDEAERSAARRAEALATISHEMRTPLNAILGFADVMRHERFGKLGNAKYRGYAKDIYDSGAHLLSLINDLLDLSRIEAGKFEMEFTEVDLAALAEDVLGLLEEQAAAARVILRRSIPDGLPPVVADERACKQILINLLSNAVKFTDPGGQVMLSVKLTRNGEMEVAVTDSGIGMSKEELKKALQPFARVRGKDGRERPGSGLGLPLAKALAEANHARLELSSRPGRGTTARLVFPPQRVLAG